MSCNKECVPAELAKIFARAGDDVRALAFMLEVMTRMIDKREELAELRALVVSERSA